MCHLLCVRISKWGKLLFSNSAVCPYIIFPSRSSTHRMSFLLLLRQITPHWVRILRRVYAGPRSRCGQGYIPSGGSGGESVSLPFSTPEDHLHLLACSPLLQLQNPQCSTYQGSLWLWFFLSSVSSLFWSLSLPLERSSVITLNSSR